MPSPGAHREYARMSCRAVAAAVILMSEPVMGIWGPKYSLMCVAKAEGRRGPPAVQ
jgi:hypothetical protein